MACDVGFIRIIGREGTTWYFLHMEGEKAVRTHLSRE